MKTRSQLQLLNSLDGAISEGEELTLEVKLALDDDFGGTEPAWRVALFPQRELRQDAGKL